MAQPTPPVRPGAQAPAAPPAGSEERRRSRKEIGRQGWEPERRRNPLVAWLRVLHRSSDPGIPLSRSGWV